MVTPTSRRELGGSVRLAVLRPNGCSGIVRQQATSTPAVVVALAAALLCVSLVAWPWFLLREATRSAEQLRSEVVQWEQNATRSRSSATRPSHTDFPCSHVGPRWHCFLPSVLTVMFEG